MAGMPSSSLQGRIYGVSVWTFALWLPGTLFQNQSTWLLKVGDFKESLQQWLPYQNLLRFGLN